MINTIFNRTLAACIVTGVVSVTLLAWCCSSPTLIGAETSAVPAAATPKLAPAATLSTPVAAAIPTAPQGQLFICGGGILPPMVLERFIELAGGPAAHIVYIPTASMYAGTPELESKLVFWRDQQVQKKLASFDILHANDRTEADQLSTVAPLVNATAVWFGGGVQARLTERYLGTAVEREVKRLLSRGGLVGGTSAGAAIMSDVMIRSGMPVPDIGNGFGFIQNAVVDQHFIKRNRHDRLVHALKKHPNRVGLGIDEGTALIVKGDKLEVIGDSKVVVCVTAPEEAATFQEIKPGQDADLSRYISQVRELNARQPNAQQIVKQVPVAKPVSASKDPTVSETVDAKLAADKGASGKIPGEKVAADTTRATDMPQTGR